MQPLLGTVNKVILLGKPEEAPKMRHSKNGDPIAKFMLITNESIRKGDSHVIHTERHRIVLFRDLAKAAAAMLKHQHLVLIEGKVHSHLFIERTGIKRYFTEIIADSFE